MPITKSVSSTDTSGYLVFATEHNCTEMNKTQNLTSADYLTLLNK